MMPRNAFPALPVRPFRAHRGGVEYLSFAYRSVVVAGGA
jgi:hypothetical protein